MAEWHRIALKLQYLGTHYRGWQRQLEQRCVQTVLEEAVASRAGHDVVVHGAGRTDTGVHAAGQVCHFETHSPIPDHHWREVLNNCLPNDLVILASAAVPNDWHARFSASWRRYRYLILNQEIPDVFYAPFSWHFRLPLNVHPMAAALESILGQNDLEAFRGAGSKRLDSQVEVQDVQCQRWGPMIGIEVQASGFLYRMMRLLVGALAFVGQGRLSPDHFVQLWQENDWLSYVPARYCAPPQGLCLTDVGYPEDPFASLRDRRSSLGSGLDSICSADRWVSLKQSLDQEDQLLDQEDQLLDQEDQLLDQEDPIDQLTSFAPSSDPLAHHADDPRSVIPSSLLQGRWPPIAELVPS